MSEHPQDRLDRIEKRLEEGTSDPDDVGWLFRLVSEQALTIAELRDRLLALEGPAEPWPCVDCGHVNPGDSGSCAKCTPP